MELTFTLMYTPKEKFNGPGDINYICSDKKLHVRLKDYNKHQVIAGFEQKLTYLVSYLVNFSTNSSAYDLRHSYKEAINNFIESEDAKKICRCVEKVFDQKVKGIKVLENYKKQKCEPLGDVSPDIFPTFVYNKSSVGYLAYFLDVLRLDLTEYLFNDRFKIIIQDSKDILEKANKKFINKQSRKYDKDSADFEQLW